jgi:hypothetical protein
MHVAVSACMRLYVYESQAPMSCIMCIFECMSDKIKPHMKIHTDMNCIYELYLRCIFVCVVYMSCVYLYVLPVFVCVSA